MKNVWRFGPWRYGLSGTTFRCLPNKSHDVGAVLCDPLQIPALFTLRRILALSGASDMDTRFREAMLC